MFIFQRSLQHLAEASMVAECKTKLTKKFAVHEVQAKSTGHGNSGTEEEERERAGEES